MRFIFSLPLNSVLNQTPTIAKLLAAQITLKVPSFLRMAGKQAHTGLNLSKYDFIGFDLDNTLCTYNLKNLFTNHYNYLSSYLNRTSYNLPTELNPDLVDFISRGLIIDVEAMNLLKVLADGEIVRACHGTKVLSTEDIVQKYGKKKKWKPLDEVIASNFLNWKTKTEMYSFMDFTDASVTAVYALAVDSGFPSQKVWFDVIEGLKTMYSDEDWLKNLLNNHKLFMNETSKKVINWIKELKKTKKIALITSNYSELVPQIASACLGSDWKKLFDVIIYDAKKPGFFSRTVPFFDLEGKETTFSFSGCYSGGCMRTIQETLAKELNREPLCLYFGDSPYHDFMFTEIDYIAIIEELKAEGLFPGNHPSAEFLSSTVWGPYLYEGEKPTLFGKFALNSKFCAPDLDFFADLPINIEFVSQLRGVSPQSLPRNSPQ
uniref:5'-nucleotidase domain-containing protein 1 n=2 Tax=Lygus hesperus TaxID=30085 RepID=A0A0A9Z8B3_LYGHE